MTQRLDPYEIFADDEWQPAPEPIVPMPTAQESDQTMDQYHQAA